MKKTIGAAVAALAISAAGLVVAAAPASAANDCKIYDAWDNGFSSSTQESNKGCDAYHGRVQYNLNGYVVWSGFGSTGYPSASQTHVWTTSPIVSNSNAVYGSSTQYRYGSSPWVNGGTLSH